MAEPLDRPEETPKRTWVGGLRSVLTAPVSILALFLTIITVYLSCSEQRRQEPSIEVRIEHYEIRQDQGKQLPEALEAELRALEDRYVQYSGNFLLEAIDRIDELPSYSTEESGEPDTGETLTSALREAHTGIQGRLGEFGDRQAELMAAFQALRRGWERSSTGDALNELLGGLERLEGTYSGDTGFVIISLLVALERSSAEPSDVGEALDEADVELRALSDERGQQFNDLLGRLGELRQEYEGNKPPERLHVRVLIENRSQLATVIRNEARIKFSREGFPPEEVDLEGASDVSVGGYSVAEMSLSSRSLSDLDNRVRALLREQEASDSLGCELVVMDLFRNVWLGGCEDSREFSIERELKRALLDDPEKSGFFWWRRP